MDHDEPTPDELEISSDDAMEPEREDADDRPEEAPAEDAPPDVSEAEELNPAQRKVNDILRAVGIARPTFANDLGDQLRIRLVHDLDDVADTLAKPLWVGKFALASVHGCEARFLHLQDQPFSVTPAIAAGTVAHKAIQLGRFHDGATPTDLVADAIARLEDSGDRTGDWLRLATAADRAEVRSIAVERVTQFDACFPPIKRRWLCITEMPVRAELCDGRIILSGRVDLSFGKPRGSTAGRAFVDLKTGGRHASHVDDLRYYALIEALRMGVPPFRVGSLYLDAAALVAEDIGLPTLLAAAARTADGIRRLVALNAGAEPVYRPSTGCRWCPLRTTCEAGRKFLGQLEDPDLDLDLD